MLRFLVPGVAATHKQASIFWENRFWRMMAGLTPADTSLLGMLATDMMTSMKESKSRPVRHPIESSVTNWANSIAASTTGKIWAKHTKDTQAYPYETYCRVREIYGFRSIYRWNCGYGNNYSMDAKFATKLHQFCYGGVSAVLQLELEVPSWFVRYVPPALWTEPIRMMQSHLNNPLAEQMMVLQRRIDALTMYKSEPSVSDLITQLQQQIHDAEGVWQESPDALDHMLDEWEREIHVARRLHLVDQSLEAASGLKEQVVSVRQAQVELRMHNA